MLWQAMWFGVILPAHTRGSIAMDGASASIGGCCAAKRTTCHDEADANTPEKSDSKSPLNRKCYLCYLATICNPLITPPAVLLPSHDLIRESVMTQRAASCHLLYVRPIFSTGPPATV